LRSINTQRYYDLYGIIAVSISILLFLNIVNPVFNQEEKVIINNQPSLTQFVNPFIGTGSTSPFGGGNTFPGAAYPLGMVQWSPDTISNPPGGYSYYDSIIKGFSLTHFSGRGCQVYQDFPFMPYVGKLIYSPATNSSLYYSNFSHTSEIAHPANYQVHLDDPNVTVELSVTPHTGIGKFTYHASALSTMIINTGGSINGNTNSSVTITPTKNEVTGSAESKVGCSDKKYKIYFAAQFDQSFSSYGTWSGVFVNSDSTSSHGLQTGAFLVFNTSSINVVRVQVGISFVSIANAKLNLGAENVNFNIDAVVKEGDAAWNKRLQSIQVQGGTSDEVISFYTALYHIFFHPNIFNDVNGQYLGFDGEVHRVSKDHAHYANIPGWDQYRTMIVLLSILAPSVVSDVVQSLVNDAQQGDGHIPRWAQANTDSHGMTGDGGSIMIAQAYAYGVRNFDKIGALNAMINGQPNIREGFENYQKIGYVPIDSGLPGASITLEYSSADFAIAQFVLALGLEDISLNVLPSKIISSFGDINDYFLFLQRSGNWQNLFNASSGYIQPRNIDGSWTSNFTSISDEGFQEGNSAQYTWMISHNLRGLFDEMGGNSAAISRLDKFFTKLNDGWYSPYAYMGNEPSVQVPWEYYFAQAPSRTQEVVRYIQNFLFNNTPEGLPGNDDAGSMSSWFIFSTIGIYPMIPGVGGFVIASPLFDSVTLNIAGEHKIQINADELKINVNELPINVTGSSIVDAYGQNPTDVQLSTYGQRPAYVHSLKINGQNTTSLWIPWIIIQKGATLNFTLSSTPSKWGSNPEDAPPSFSPHP